MSWLSSFMHPGRAYDAAQKETERYYNEAQGYQQPYNQHGQDVYGDYVTAMKRLMDPKGLEDEWVKGYTESEAAKNAEDRAQQHGLDAASSMGLMGSSPALNAIQAGTTQIGLDDRQNYLDRMMQKYITGLNTAGSIYGIGANTAGQQGQNAMTQGQNSAQLTYNKNAAGGNMFGNIVGTVGGAVGAPIGKAVGNKVANKWII